jgi:predicted SAM-dependent methyltransferase
MGAKQWLKRPLRPLVRRFDARVNRAVLAQCDLVLAETRSVASVANQGRADMDRTIPVLLEAMSTQSATARAQWRAMAEHSDRMKYLEHRLEFVRKEVLFETRYGASREQTTVEPEIIDPDVLVRAGDKLRINLGAGHLPLPDYVNVDSRALDGIDVVAEVGNLPFETGSVAEIFSAHFLEHFPREELRRSVLPYLVSLLRPGGTFVAVVPDMEAMVRACADGQVTFEEFFEVTYGGQEYGGDFHFSGFTPHSMRDILAEAGLSTCKVRESARRNGLCYEMEIEATKPATLTRSQPAFVSESS